MFYVRLNHYYDLNAELKQITGIAAILRFPMPELEDEEVSSDEEPETVKRTLNFDNMDDDESYSEYDGDSTGDKSGDVSNTELE